MPMPMELQRASQEFEAYLADTRETTGLTTRNQIYTTTQGVLHSFRRRLDLDEAIRFAGVLPPILRAIFVADWDTSEPKSAFGERADWTKDAQALRKDHNFSSDTCVRDVAAALRKHVDKKEFERTLATLTEAAKDFWRA